MTIKAILSDLGNVLVKNHPEQAAKKFAKLNHLSLKHNLTAREENEKYMRNEITSAAFAQGHIERLHLNISETEFHKIYVDIFDLNKQLLRLFSSLQNHVQLVMLSNCEQVTVEFLKKKFPELFEVFNKQVLSYELGLIKPQKEIYLAALRMGNAKPHEAVFFDDKPMYVNAAKRLGIHAFQYTTVAQAKRDLQSVGLYAEHKYF